MVLSNYDEKSQWMCGMLVWATLHFPADNDDNDDDNNNNNNKIDDDDDDSFSSSTKLYIFKQREHVW